MSEPTQPAPNALHVDREVRARLSAILGLLSLGLLMTGTCACLSSWPIAMALAIPGAWIGASMHNDLDLSPAGKVYAQVGVVSGAVSLVLMGIMSLGLIVLLILQIMGIVELFSNLPH